MMKKAILALFLILTVAITGGAQSLTSKDWGAETEAQNGATVTIMTSFENDGSCIMLMFMNMEIERGTLMMAMIAPGTYTFNGKRLSMKINTHKAQFYDDIDMKASNKGLADKMNHVMKQELDKYMPHMKQDFLGIVADYSTLEVTKLTGNKMETTIGTFAGYDKGTLQKMCTE